MKPAKKLFDSEGHVDPRYNPLAYDEGFCCSRVYETPPEPNSAEALRRDLRFHFDIEESASTWDKLLCFFWSHAYGPPTSKRTDRWFCYRCGAKRGRW
jgi:hypothetical protein